MTATVCSRILTTYTYLFASVRVDEVLEVFLVAEFGFGDQVIELHQAAGNYVRLLSYKQIKYVCIYIK